MPSTAVQPTDGALAVVSTRASTAPIAIDVVSDVICPWCYIARARLAGIARSCGLDDAGPEAYLRSGEDEDAVVREQDLAIRRGLRGVPAVLHGDRFLRSGAVPASDIVRALVAVHEQGTSSAPSTGPAAGEPGRPDVDTSPSIFRAER